MQCSAGTKYSLQSTDIMRTIEMAVVMWTIIPPFSRIFGVIIGRGNSSMAAGPHFTSVPLIRIVWRWPVRQEIKYL